MVIVVRKSGYDKRITPQLVKWMARGGLTEVEIAAELGINPSTLTRWKQRHPELVEALKESRDFVDSLVEDALLKRALGYEYEEVKMIVTQDGKTRRIEKTKKVVLPDVTAQIFWLKNRQPEKWRDKPQPDATDDSLKAIADALKEARKAQVVGDED